MLFPNFRLLIWALGLERAQENLSKFQVINTIQPQTLPCELAVIYPHLQFAILRSLTTGKSIGTVQGALAQRQHTHSL